MSNTNEDWVGYRHLVDVVIPEQERQIEENEGEIVDEDDDESEND
jgi:hypothetical protein